MTSRQSTKTSREGGGGGGGDKVWPPGTKVTGRYNFPGSASHDLPFRKNDVLEIISQSRDPNWYKAKRNDGREGMIPFNYVVEQQQPEAEVVIPPIKGEVKLQTMPWFHGKINRDEAEKLLTPAKNGLFLVRESTAYKGDYTLCVCYDGKVEHYRVRKDKREWVTVDDEEYFETLFKLVEHYEKDADGLCSRLKMSVEKTGNVDIVVSQEDFIKQGWSIPRSLITMKSIIGKGEFGEVWLAEYNGSKVAIKMLKEIQTEQDTQKFLAEASVMTTLQHPNLVSLIGVSLDKRPIYLVTEYMGRGSLQEYLRCRGRSVISQQNLLDFAKNVCTGMKYLESKNFIHRDLAARNVLISDDNVAKVSDFGLAREGVTRTDSQKLPVKWTAPEALKNSKKFSNKSDVWSFGILLWEIYSYGRVPYPRVPVNDIMQHVDKGYRMDAPNGCPDAIYAIMRTCWEEAPENRPLFSEIFQQLNEIPHS